MQPHSDNRGTKGTDTFSAGNRLFYGFAKHLSHGQRLGKSVGPLRLPPGTFESPGAPPVTGRTAEKVSVSVGHV
jgi:hypothetical protein